MILAVAAAAAVAVAVLSFERSVLRGEEDVDAAVDVDVELGEPLLLLLLLDKQVLSPPSGVMIFPAAYVQLPNANLISESPVRLPIAKTFGATSMSSKTLSLSVWPERVSPSESRTPQTS